MKLYIPEIRDKLVLSRPSKITLHAESRNVDLAVLAGFEYYWSGEPRIWIPKVEHDRIGVIKEEFWEKAAIINKKIYDLEESRIRFLKTHKKEIKSLNVASRTLTVNLQKEIDRVIKPFKNNNTIHFDLLKGDTLIVDRIYIRKGASDYSSLSFYLHRDGLKAKPRFWVKLEEVNKLYIK